MKPLNPSAVKFSWFRNRVFALTAALMATPGMTFAATDASAVLAKSSDTEVVMINLRDCQDFLTQNAQLPPEVFTDPGFMVKDLKANPSSIAAALFIKARESRVVAPTSVLGFRIYNCSYDPVKGQGYAGATLFAGPNNGPGAETTFTPVPNGRSDVLQMFDVQFRIVYGHFEVADVSRTDWKPIAASIDKYAQRERRIREQVRLENQEANDSAHFGCGSRRRGYQLCHLW